VEAATHLKQGRTVALIHGDRAVVSRVAGMRRRLMPRRRLYSAGELANEVDERVRVAIEACVSAG
jgi:hypothetical protein